VKPHVVVPVGEEMKESGYSLNSFLFISDGKVVVEALRSLFECAVPSLYVIPDAKRLLDPIQFQ